MNKDSKATLGCLCYIVMSYVFNIIILTQVAPPTTQRERHLATAAILFSPVFAPIVLISCLLWLLFNGIQNLSKLWF